MHHNSRLKFGLLIFWLLGAVSFAIDHNCVTINGVSAGLPQSEVEKLLFSNGYVESPGPSASRLYTHFVNNTPDSYVTVWYSSKGQVIRITGDLLTCNGVTIKIGESFSSLEPLLGKPTETYLEATGQTHFFSQQWLTVRTGDIITIPARTDRNDKISRFEIFKP